MKRKKKNLLKRIVALVLVVAMTLGVVPMPEIVEELREDILGDKTVLTVHAASNPTITTIEELQAYATGYTSANQNDTITISCSDRLLIPYDFQGIGTSDAPFEGQLIIMNVLNDNGGASRYLQLRAPLFNYISDKATIVDSNLTQCTLYLFPAALESGMTFDKPLFANHVAGTGGTANWKIRVNDFDVTANGGAGAVQINSRSTIIGEIYNKSASPNVTIDYFNQNASINGNGDLGVICNTISSGSLTVSLSNDLDTGAITTTAGNVGGLVGTMASGTSLILNTSIAYANKRTIQTSSGYAGGIVGKCEGTLTLGSGITYNDSRESSIGGTLGSGGLFGYYKTSSDVTFDLDNFIITSEQGDGNSPGHGIGHYQYEEGQSPVVSGKSGGLIGELVNSGSNTSISFTASSIPTDSKIVVSLAGDYGGGLIGHYTTASLDNSLEIQNVYCASEGSTSVYYGGLIGTIESTNNCGAYVDIAGARIVASSKQTDVNIDRKACNSKSAGIVYSATNSFLNISGNVSIDSKTPANGNLHSGIIYTSNGGVIRLSGTTDISRFSVSNGAESLLAVNRDNTLIYALGSGADYNSTNGTGWNYIRPSTTEKIFDDIKSWGQVVRYVSTSSSDANEKNLEDAGVVSVSGNVVTLAAADTSMTTSADFAKTALNIKLNTSNTDFGALKFTAGNASGTILSGTMSLEADIDLAGSGLTGLTKDDGTNASYTSTFDGKNHTIKLATGEAYGYIDSTSTPASITNGSAYLMTGAIQYHDYNGLFAKLGGSTIKDLTIDGFINSSGTSIGGLAAVIDGETVNLNNVDTAFTSSSNQFVINSYAGTNVGFLIGNIPESTPSALNISGSDIKGTIYSRKKDSKIGTIGVVTDKNITITTNEVLLSAGIDYSAAGGASIGGFVGGASGESDRLFKLNGIVIDGMSITTNNTSGGIDSPAGSLLGGKWHDTNVIFKDSSHSSGVAVTNGTLTLTGTNNTYAGGLVGEATGYWQINDVELNAMNVSGATDALGLLVMRGKNGKAGTSGLYLEITSPSAYSITSSGLTLPNSVNVFDEIMAYSKSAVSVGSGYVPSESNGQAIVSIHTSDIDETPKLSMGTPTYNAITPNYSYGEVTPVGTENPSTEEWYERSGEEGDYEYSASSDITVDSDKTYYERVFSENPSALGWYEYSDDDYSVSSDSVVNTTKTYYFQVTDNSYQPQTTLGANHNPFSRYYYNLDYLLTNASSGGEKLLLWSVNKYATSNISSNAKIKSERTKSFSDYKTFPSETALDLSYLSYYPVNVTEDLEITGKTVTFHNSEMQNSHGGKYSLNSLDSSDRISQHYLMHAGLFKDVSKNLTVSNMALKGSVSAHDESASVDAGSGAIVCGSITGASADSKTQISISNLSLDGIKVNGTTGINALIIKKIGSNTNATISQVSATNQYVTDNTTTAAKYLIGDAAGSAMTIVFDKMVLDGRTTSSSLYNPTAASGTTAYDHNQAYKTYQSIFSDATFLRSLNYSLGTGSSAKYDYKWEEDWGATKHQVTYGYEVSNTLENLDGSDSKQSKYVDRYNNVYTSPESNNLLTDPYDFSTYRPHVSVVYNSATNYHEVAVNIVSDSIDDGCGTYNDPYIVSGNQLKVIADILSDTGDDTGVSNGFYLNIDNDFVTTNYTEGNADINFAKYCENKDGHSKFTYTSELGKFSGTVNGVSKTLSVRDVKDYLAGAYYYVYESTTLPSTYVGLGGASSRNAFRGVIVGAAGVEIENQSDKPFVNVSNGCVIKNLTLNVTHNSIVKSAETNAAFGYSTTTEYYGAVIGEIMGGDNIIDAVQVRFTDNISVSGTYFQNVPVGGYIGVVVNGSVFFRNMNQINTTNSSIVLDQGTPETTDDVTVEGMNYHVKKNGTGNDIQGEVVIDQSNGKETFTSLYVNPIIGRVINGFAVNETKTSSSTGTYRYSEDNKYVDWTSTNGRTRGTSSDQVSLKNNRKNFSIPDFNSTSKLNVTLSNKNGTITADDAQELYILSLILQTNMGSALTASADYGTTQASGYDSGTRNYRATHLASYDGVGKLQVNYAEAPGDEPALPEEEPQFQESGYENETQEEYEARHSIWQTTYDEHEEWVTANANYTAWTTALANWNALYNNSSDSTKNDVNVTYQDKANSAQELPYLIYAYTDNVSGNYHARTISNTNNKFDLNLNSSASTYYLPDSFRGIGSVSSDVVYLTIKNLNGYGNTVDLNTYYRIYASEVDNTFSSTISGGVGLFNYFVHDGTSFQSGKPMSTSKVIGNFTLTGYMSGKRTDGTKKATEMAAAYGDVYVGGLAPVTKSGKYNISNIDFNNLVIDSNTSAGAIFARITTDVVYINNCNANKLKVSGYRQLGGLVGTTEKGLYINTTDNASSSFVINVHQLNAGNTNCSTGGLIGTNSKSIIVKNVDIIGWNGDFDTSSSKKPFIGRDYNETINNDKLYVGGVVGSLGNPGLFDNIHVYGVNLYGYEVGGIVGYDGASNGQIHTVHNCGLHGKSSTAITISNDTYTIKAQVHAGGIVGRSWYQQDGTSYTINSHTLNKCIDGCAVNNYTIESVGTGQDPGNAAGGIVGAGRNDKYISNSKVDTCTIICNGSNRSCAAGGILGTLSKYDFKGYNLVVKDLTFKTNAVDKNNGSVSTYGLLIGGRSGNDDYISKNPVGFQVVGFTSLGTNTVLNTFGNKITDTPRNVEFDFGRYYAFDASELNKLSYSSDTEYGYKVKASGTKYSYIIYSDYEGACELDNSSIGSRGTTLSTVNGGNNTASFSANDNFPYANSSPSVTIGDKTLTGDGIWFSQDSSGNITLKADSILADRTTYSSTYLAKKYANITDADVTAYTALKDKISTLNTQLGNDLLENDIPVIVLDNPSSVPTDAICAYIRILTNASYTFKEYGSSAFNIVPIKCVYDGTSLNCTTSGATVTRDGSGVLHMAAGSYDSTNSGQFTVLDVQFKNPASDSQVAYHLYIPVYTKKAFNFKFDITAISGTSYYSSDYTTGTHLAGVNSNPSTRGESSNIVVENYSSPVTMYLRYEYDTEDIITDLLGSGYGLNWNYNKALDLIYNLSNDDALPDGTKFILIDPNNKDKVNYSTGFSPLPNADLDINATSFPAFTVDGSNYGAYNVVSFKDLLAKQGIQFTATLLSDSDAITAAQDAGTPIFHAETTDENNSLQFDASGVTAGKSLVLATSGDITTRTELYTIAASAITLYEDYYLTIIAPADDGDRVHQINFKGKTVLESGEKIKANCEKNDNVILMFANLFTKDISITTVEADNADKEMGTSGQSAIDIRAITKVSFNSTGLGNQLNEVRRTLNDRDVEIYDSTQLQFVKIEADSTQQTIAVDGVAFTLNSAPSESLQNYMYNSGVYAKMADGTTGENIFYSADSETTDRYKQVVSCTNSNTDFVGSRITNFYEVINKNSGYLIDIRPYLTGEYFGEETPHEVEIVANFKMTYNPNGILEQFALRESGSSAGTIVKGLASLAYQPDGTTYSTNTSDLVDAMPLNRKYYRKDASKTTLYYNVVTSNTLASADAKIKTNSVLGINPLDKDTDTRSAISTWGNYDASQLSGAGSATNVKWTLSIYRRQKTIQGGVESGEEYGEALPINDYLKDIKLFGIDQSDASKGTEIALTSSTLTELMYIAPRSSFEDLTLRNNPEDDTEKTNKFISYVDFNVVTGADLETASQFYSNYKVILTAELVGDASSKASDHVIYTNARLDPSFVDKTAN